MESSYIEIIVFTLLVAIFSLVVFLACVLFELRRDIKFLHQVTRNTNSVSERLKILLDSINKNYFRLVSALTHKPVDNERMEGGKDDH